MNTLHALPGNELSDERLSLIIDLLLECETMKNLSGRLSILEDMGEMSQYVCEDAKPRVHTRNIVKECLRQQDGLERLVARVADFESAGALPVQRLAFCVDLAKSRSGGRITARWRDLFAVVQIVSATLGKADLENAWVKSVPPLAPRDSKLPATLSEAVRRMAQYGDLALLGLLVRVHQAVPSSELDGWINGAASDAGFTNEVREMRADTPQATVYQLVLLLIEFAPAPKGSNRFTVRAWIVEDLKKPLSIYPDEGDDESPMDLEAARKIVRQLVNKAREHTDRFRVEFIVPDENLEGGYEFWQYSSGRVEATLGATYPVVVRSLERSQDASIIPTWKAKWNKVVAAASPAAAPELTWICQPGDRTVDQLLATLAAESAGTWAFFAFSPLRDPVGRDLLTAVIDAGVPIVAWLRTECGVWHEEQEALRSLFDGHIPNQTPWAAREARRHAVMDPSATAPGHRLTLVYDDPTLTPVQKKPRAPKRTGFR